MFNIKSRLVFSWIVYDGWSNCLCAPDDYALQQITPLSQHTSFLPHYLVQSDCLAADRQGQGETRFTLTPSVIPNSDCLAADRQGQGETRFTLTPSVIPNSNYVIMVSDWKCLKYICVFFFCTVIIRCTETFWSPCIWQTSDTCVYVGVDSIICYLEWPSTRAVGKLPQWPRVIIGIIIITNCNWIVARWQYS
jgi:hypothetical protein